MGGGDAPRPPDPVKTAAAQTKSNKETALYQAQLNAMNQSTPYGTLSYKQVGTWPDGTPRFEASVALDSSQQGLLDQQNALSAQYGDTAQSLLNQVQGQYSKPFDFDQAATQRFDEIGRSRLDPYWNQRQQSLESQLANSGITRGSEAYDRAMREHEQARADQYNQMLYNNYGQEWGRQMEEYNSPLSILNAFRTGSQPKDPTFQNTPQTGVAGTDVAGITNNAYQQQYNAWQQQQQGQNALLGNMLGMAGTVLGGPIGGSIGSSIGGWMSDERTKDDYGVVGETFDGMPIHAYTYKGEPRGMMRMGLMAQDVAKSKPEAVRRTPSGMMAVRYDKALAA